VRIDEYTNMYLLEDCYWWYRGIHDLILRYFIKEAGARRLRILDAGCGTGKLLTLLAPLADVSGIDGSEDALRFCRERGLSNVAFADLNSWEGKGAAYDVITSIDVLCHESIRDVGGVVGKLGEALVPGGVLMLNLPAFESLRRQHDAVVHTVRRYRKEEFLPLLERRCLRVEVATYRLPVLYCLIRMKKAIFPEKPGVEPSSDLRTIWRAFDDLLWQMHRLENWAILRGARFPVGSSLFVVARRGASG
jgi:SAM-dependent methyltransferase